LVLASHDEVVTRRVPLNTGILALKRHPQTLVLIDEVFRLGRRLQLLDGYIWLPRLSGLWDQDAFAAYIHWHGAESFALLEHRKLQSIARRTHSSWQPGDFAVHFTGLADVDPEGRAELIRNFMKRL